MDRVVWSIGHGNNTYPPSKGIKLPNGEVFEEHTFNSEVVLAGLELAEHNGFDIYLPQMPHSPEVPLKRKINMINAEHKKKPFLCLQAFHANASTDKKASGKGVFYWHTSKEGKKLAKAWHKNSNILPIKDWGNGVWESKPKHWSNMGILRQTYPPAILMEHFFFTNLKELEKCNTKEFIKLAAEVAVKTLCDYVGREFKPLEKSYFSLGDKGKSVKLLQGDLLELGYNFNGYGADGSYGPVTEKTVRKFQKDNKLEVDGLAGPNTLKMIEKLLEEKKQLFRVIVDGKQVGAYKEDENIVGQVKNKIENAKEIKIEKIGKK